MDGLRLGNFDRSKPVMKTTGTLARALAATPPGLPPATRTGYATVKIFHCQARQSLVFVICPSGFSILTLRPST